ncbi:His-Xaa-Ser system protein HxsD [Variovorax paradoxus]|uniref:His-Xaa-Ser system protein HxsD n=1 Tax=Variovorax paradoxus TaxID=34073 RepID=UPI0033987308
MTITLTFDSGIYSELAIEKACYRLNDRLSFDIKADQGSLIVAIESRRRDSSDTAMDLAVQDFRAEVLDQNLREKIKVETAPVRNLILAHAFSRTGLIDDERA